MGRSDASRFYHNDPAGKTDSGRVYAAHASDGHGGSASVTFGFDKDGTMIFLDSVDD